MNGKQIKSPIDLVDLVEFWGRGVRVPLGTKEGRAPPGGGRFEWTRSAWTLPGGFPWTHFCLGFESSRSAWTLSGPFYLDFAWDRFEWTLTGGFPWSPGPGPTLPGFRIEPFCLDFCMDFLPVRSPMENLNLNWRFCQNPGGDKPYQYSHCTTE